MAFIKVDWRHDKDFTLNEQVSYYWDSITPNIDGDEVLVYKNTDNGEYCAYWKLWDNGRRLTLAQHMALFEDVCCYENVVGNDPETCNEIYELLDKKAANAGFPKSWHDMPRALTWRELINEILEHPELLDETAYVWTPDSGMPHDDFTEITGITPYDADAPADGENFLSINLRNW